MLTRAIRRAGRPLAVFTPGFALAVALGVSLPAAAGQNQSPQQRQMQGTAARLMNTYRLTPGNVDKTITAGQLVVKAAKNDPSFLKQLSAASEGDKTLDDVASRIEANPVTSTALKAAGISGHDFIGTITVFTMAYGYVQLSKMDQQAAQQAFQQQGPVAAENIAYIGAHPEQVKQMEELQKQMKQVENGGSDKQQ